MRPIKCLFQKNKVPHHVSSSSLYGYSEAGLDPGGIRLLTMYLLNHTGLRVNKNTFEHIFWNRSLLLGTKTARLGSRKQVRPKGPLSRVSWTGGPYLPPLPGQSRKQVLEKEKLF